MEENKNWKVYDMSKKSDAKDAMYAMDDIVADIENQMTGLDDPTKIDEAREQELAALQEMQDAFTEEYEKAEEEALSSSKALVEGLYDLMLEGDVTDDDLINSKIQLDAMSLSNIVFQTGISKRAIFKLAMQIEVGEPHPRHFEVLGQLQRVLLDTSKYQSDYIKDIMGGLEMIREVRSNRPDQVQTETMKADGVSVITSDRAALMRQIKSLELGVVNIPKIKSNNPLLNEDGTGEDSQPRNLQQMMGEKDGESPEFETEEFE